jgi:RNA processing factor Prp31
MFYLLETPVGIAIFKNTEQLSLIAKINYPSNNIAIEMANSMNNIKEPVDIPENVKSLISENVPTLSTLNIMNPAWIDIFNSLFKLNTVSIPDETFRKLKKNSFKWFGVNKDLFNVLTVRMAHKMTEGLQQDISLIDTLEMIEDLDKNINNRTMRIREWYSLHFPELNTVADNVKYLKYVIAIGSRSEFLSKSKEQNLDADEIPESIIYGISNSMGTAMPAYDINMIKENATNILKDINYKAELNAFLKSKCKTFFPNLNNLVGEHITAKLIRKIGSISRLAQCPSSTIQILGAEKAYNEAVKCNGNTPKYGIIYDSYYVGKATDENKGKIARVLANKIALCARADSQSQCTDGLFGMDIRNKLEKILEKMEDSKLKPKIDLVQKKKKFVSVKDYDHSKDSVKKIKH